MQPEQEKCVIVLDETLPLGVLANTAAILGVTLGKHIPQAVGPDVTDNSGRAHLGIIQLPVPILKASKETIQQLRRRLYTPEYAALTAVDFSDVAQRCNVYADYEANAAQTDESAFCYFGVAVCGAKKLVNKLTGSLPLLR